MTHSNNSNVTHRSSISTLAIVIVGFALTSVSGATHAQSSDPFYSTAAFNACYRQAQVALSESDNRNLTTISCRRALKNKPMSNKQEAATLYNMSVIQLTQGKTELARENLETAVAITKGVGVAHLALAQLTFKQGDYLKAASLYQALLDSGLEQPALARNRSAIEKNRELAMMAANVERVARNIQ